MTLILFMVGVLGTLLVNVRAMSRHIKEQLPMEIFFKNDAAQEQIMALMEIIRPSKFVKKFQYIDKDQAMKIAKKELNIQDENLLEYQIFPASIRMTISIDYVDRIIKMMTNLAIVDEVKYPRDLLQEIHSNIEKWSIWIIGFAILFLVIAIALINNAIRLSIYSKRFIIKSMQLVGAKRSFIYSTFLKRSLWWGIFGGLIALIALTILSYYMLEIIDFQYKQDYYTLGGLALGIFLLGIIISSGSTYLAVRRFLRSTTDELYHS
ncbi:MAG: permease-like cell division protein FtsX [Flavobacteriales bacterium]